MSLKIAYAILSRTHDGKVKKILCFFPFFSEYSELRLITRDDLPSSVDEVADLIVTHATMEEDPKSQTILVTVLKDRYGPFPREEAMDRDALPVFNSILYPAFDASDPDIECGILNLVAWRDR